MSTNPTTESLSRFEWRCSWWRDGKKCNKLIGYVLQVGLYFIGRDGNYKKFDFDLEYMRFKCPECRKPVEISEKDLRK
jgi:hypothetical protein